MLVPFAAARSTPWDRRHAGLVTHLTRGAVGTSIGRHRAYMPPNAATVALLGEEWGGSTASAAAGNAPERSLSVADHNIDISADGHTNSDVWTAAVTHSRQDWIP